MIRGYLVLLLMSSAFWCQAQLDSLQSGQFQLVGLQANQLIKQVLSFGGGSPAVNNPYLINYSFNNQQTGWGMAFGLGFDIRNSKDGDEFNERETKINQFQFRIGLDHKKSINERLILGWGFDLTREDVTNETVNTTRFDANNTQKVTTLTERKGWGLGPRVFFGVAITQRILVSTEASYYLTFLKSDSSIETRNGTSLDTNEFESDLTNFNLILPSVIHLHFMF